MTAPATHDRALHALSLLDPAMPTRPRGLVELLWHERRVESFGLTHRITIPLAGHAFDGSTSQLAALLGQWWAQPGRLSNGTSATFVAAEVVDPPLAPAELVLTVTTGTPVGETQVANLRTIQDLRKAVRELRREGFVDRGSTLAVA